MFRDKPGVRLNLDSHLKNFLFLTFTISVLVVNAQFIEFGGGLGASYYTGDLNHYPRISKSRLAGTAIYRMNLSEIVSLKLALTAGKLSGDDFQPIDELSVQRQYKYSHSFLEFSSVFEYHFIDYRSDIKRIKWSPYAMLGIGFMKLNNTEPAFVDYNRFQFVLPMGGGVKYILGKRLTLGFEAGVRKTFTDYIDGLSDGDQTIKDYQYGNPKDKDWYFFTGISLTYVLYNIPCPFPYVPNRSILNKIRPY